MSTVRTALVLLSLSIFTTTPLSATCLNGGTDATIRAALGTAANAEAVLCAGSTFDIYASINMTANGQKIYTEGLPGLLSYAVLSVRSSNVVTVISGRGRSGAELRNVLIEGGADIYGFNRVGAAAMVDFGGNAANQVVDHVVAFQPRGWSTIYVNEGSPSWNGSSWSGGCTAATITNNWVANAGLVDAQENWADGIGLACRNSEVADNLIQNATDGGIVVFGSPGSIVEDNTIENSAESLGGINLVDVVGYAGDFTGTIVRNNTITSANIAGGTAFTHIGIAIGHRAWFQCSTDSVRNGTVTGNTFDGSFGYAMAVDGATNWTVTGNIDAGVAPTGSAPYDNCTGWSASSGVFKKHATHATGTYQSGFVEGQLHHGVDIQ